MQLIFPLCCAFSLMLLVAAGSSPSLLDQANTLFASGSVADAIATYGKAISEDPKAMLAYYRRAIAYQKLSQYSLAVRDISKALKLKPSFYQAYLQRARAHLRNGHFDDAQADIANYKAAAPSTAQKNDDLTTLESEVNEAINATKNAERLTNDGKHDQAIDSLTAALVHAPSSISIRLNRADIHLRQNLVDRVVGDLLRVLILSPNDLTLYIRTARLQYYTLYEPKEAMTQLCNCLINDPEYKSCKEMLRRVKVFTKRIDRAQANIDATSPRASLDDITHPETGLLYELEQDEKKLEGNVKTTKLKIKLMTLACDSALKLKDSVLAKAYCKQLCDLDKEDSSAMLKQGEALLLADDYEDAVRVLSRANDIAGQNNRSIQDLLQKAQRLMRQSKKKDYYKILGINRSASKRDIKRAFRKMAIEFHPDKYRGELTKQQVQDKMTDINQAYEVLSNDESRTQFDNGIDPNDPTSGHHGSGGGHDQGASFARFFQNGFPFAQGGGGGFDFKYEF